MAQQQVIRRINKKNMRSELALVDKMMHRLSFVSFDTEYPKFLRKTKRYGATDQQRYDDLKYTVDRQKLLQAGLTLFDIQGNIAGTWEINFSDAGLFTTDRVLRKKGIDPKTNWTEGVDSEEFAEEFVLVLMNHFGRLKWITFHGLYDMAYMLRLITGEDTPNSISEFAEAISDVFNIVIDVKYMASYCSGLDFDVEKLSLKFLARMLGVDRIGEEHQAGSDSLLTAEVFVKMVGRYDLINRGIDFSGFLHGIGTRLMKANQNPSLLSIPVQQINYHRSPTVYAQFPIMPPYYMPIRPAPCYAPIKGVAVLNPHSVPFFIY